MPRLIDAHRIVYSWTIDNDGEQHDGVTLQSIIDKLPTVDAVEVVRCKDCIYGEPNGQYGCKCYHYKLYETHDMSANDFCSKGKRREDGKID